MGLFFSASPKSLRHLTWKFVRQHTHTKCHTLKWCNLRQFSIISKSIRTHGPFNLGAWFLKNLMDIFAPFLLSSLSSFRSGPLYKINMATQRLNCCLESCHLSKIIQNKGPQFWFFRSSLSLIFGGVFSWTLKQKFQFWRPALFAHPRIWTNKVWICWPSPPWVAKWWWHYRPWAQSGAP